MLDKPNISEPHRESKPNSADKCRDGGNFCLPDYDAALAALRIFAHDNIAVPACFPFSGGGMRSQWLDLSDEPTARTFLMRLSTTGNAYFHINPFEINLDHYSETEREAAEGRMSAVMSFGGFKARREDVTAIHWLWTDLDPNGVEDDGVTFRANRAKIAALLADETKLKAMGLPGLPTVTMDSGGGYWGFWKLRIPVPVVGNTVDERINSADAFSAYNRGIQVAFAETLGNAVKADAVIDACRIARLPGLINQPDADKMARGQVARRACIIDHAPERTYVLGQFKRVDGPVGASPAPSKGSVNAMAKSFKSAQRIPGNDAGEKIGWLQDNYPLIGDETLWLISELDYSEDGGRRGSLPKRSDGKTDRSGGYYRVLRAILHCYPDFPRELMTGLLLDPNFSEFNAAIREIRAYKGNPARRRSDREADWEARRQVAKTVLKFEKEKAEEVAAMDEQARDEAVLVGPLEQACKPYTPAGHALFEDIPELAGEEFDEDKRILMSGYDEESCWMCMDNPDAVCTRQFNDDEWLYSYGWPEVVPRDSPIVPNRQWWIRKAISSLLGRGIAPALVSSLLISPALAGAYSHVGAQKDPVRYAQEVMEEVVLDEDTIKAPPETADKIFAGAERGASRKAGKLSIPTYVEELNKKHAVLLQEGGKTRVLSWSASEIAGDNREVVVLQSFEDFRNRYMNRTVNVGTAQEPKWKPLGKVWLEHPARRQHLEIRFMPGQPTEVGDYLNLWRGFAVEPKPGDWSLMKEHILSILAGGNQEYADYILNWAAWAVQNPDLPAEVALVFKGPKGAGKGIFARLLKGIFGQHGLQITSSAHLTGRFNAHLRDCCLLFADEAIAPGDRTAEAVLKGLITEPELPIEGKGVNVIQARNHLHVIMASNDDWVVPAGADERRFAVFEATRNRIGDSAYFAAISKQMANGGRAAMLYELLNRPIEGWHPRQNVPDTEALRKQKELGLKPEDQFILSILEDGVLPGKRLAGKDNAVHSRDRDHRHGLYDEMARICPPLEKLSEVKLSAIVKQWGAVKVGNGSARGWQFKPLAEMRADWDVKFGRRDWSRQPDWAYEGGTGHDPDDLEPSPF